MIPAAPTDDPVSAAPAETTRHAYCYRLRDLVFKALELTRLRHVPAIFDEASSEDVPGDRIVGRSPAMQQVYKTIGRVASEDVTVLIHCQQEPTQMQVTLIRSGHFVDDSNSLPISVEEAPMIIGRSQDADVRIADPWASRVHCELANRNGMVVVRDLDSANGTLVNACPVGESPILPGELLTVGITSFRVHYEPAGHPRPAARTLYSGEQFPYSPR